MVRTRCQIRAIRKVWSSKEHGACSLGGAMGTESGPAAAGSSTLEKEGSLWSILPSFDPQQDDPREYRDKITFLHGICPKKTR